MPMISQTVEYALRAVVSIAEHPDEAMRTRYISELTKVPVDYLFKVLRSLAAKGVLKSVRGVGGGFKLARPAAQISVLDVVNAIDPLPRICSCPLELPNHHKKLCPLHKRLDEAIKKVEEAFRLSTIASISSQAKPKRTFETVRKKKKRKD